MTHDSVDRYNALKRLKTIEDDLKKIKTTNTPDQKNVDNAYNSLIIFFFFFFFFKKKRVIGINLKNQNLKKILQKHQN